MLKKSIIASVLMLAGFTAFAAGYYVVVPVPAKTKNLSNITVKVGSYALPSGLVGQSYSGFDFNNALQVTGDLDYNSSLVSWSIASGSLPAGLSLSTGGLLTGTPTTAGTASFTLAASYKSASGTQSYQVVVGSLTVALAEGAPPQATVGKLYTYDLKSLLAVTGDNGYTGTGVTWTTISSTLPAGLALSSNGVIYGTPTASGSGSVTARAAYRGVTGEQQYQVVVGTVSVSLASATLRVGTVNAAYSYDLNSLFTVTGDATYKGSDVTWSVISGSLPAGTSLSSAGVISGTPTTVGIANFGIRATYKSNSAEQTYALPIQPLANFAATQAGVKIGTSALGTYTTDDYYGPNGYSYSTTSGSWTAIGAFIHDSTTLNTDARPVKGVSIASTFRGGGSAVEPKMIVLDLGQERTFNIARYYQTFSDGKTTHAALDVSASGELETRTSTNWTQVHDFVALDNSSTSTGVAANFGPVTARYVRLRLYNNGVFGSTGYTELYGFKLFNQ